jgi:hypothetical protein
MRHLHSPLLAVPPTLQANLVFQQHSDVKPNRTETTKHILRISPLLQISTCAAARGSHTLLCFRYHSSDQEINQPKPLSWRYLLLFGPFSDRQVWTSHSLLTFREPGPFHRESLRPSHCRAGAHRSDLFGTGADAERQSLRTALPATYVPLDPSLPSEGPHAAKWRLQLNIPADELLAPRSN